MKVFTVREVNNHIGNILSNEYLLKKICIKGEITNYKPSRAHSYFDLKDESGILPCVMFDSYKAEGLDFKIDNGIEVECIGRVEVYMPAGRYQYKITAMKQAGIGEFARRLEELKMRLYEEGLFDFEHKKPIPKTPKAVGIVSSLNASGLQDVLDIAKRRNPYVQLVLCDANVQGKNAVRTIVSAIKRLDAMNLDTIILCRGGGSHEDLKTFNDEEIVRAVYEADTPIISAVSHADFVFLTDYAADLRTETPSAACECAIPDVVTTIETLKGKERLIRRNMQSRLDHAKLLLEKYGAVLEAGNPVNNLKSGMQRLDELAISISHSMEKKYTDYTNRLLTIQPLLAGSMDKKFIDYKTKLDVIIAKLHGLSPTAKLVGGFGYIESDGKPVTSASCVSAGEDIKITLSDGVIGAKVTDITEGK